MDKQLVATTLKNLRENSPKRNFKQSIDLVINLKDLDLKKPEHQINIFVTLHHDNGKKVSVCALVGKELEKNAKEICDEVILSEQLDKFKGKKEIKKLANKHDFFISQANIMPKVATVFGRFLGPRGKMPNPKIGGVLPPNANIKPLYEKLRRTVNLVTRNEPIIKCVVGKEDSNDDGIIDNIFSVYNSIILKLPNEKHNVKSVIIKQTMGPAFKIGEEVKDNGKEKAKHKIKSKEVAKKDTKEKTTETKKQEPKENKEEIKIKKGPQTKEIQKSKTENEKQ